MIFTCVALQIIIMQNIFKCGANEKLIFIQIYDSFLEKTFTKLNT